MNDKYLDAKKEQITIYQTLFKTKDGEYVLADLRKAFGDRPSFVTDNTYQTAYNEGQRSIYLRIIKILEIDLKKFIKEGSIKNEQY